MSQPERIIGIDPGTVEMGFGVIERVGSELRLIDLGSVKFTASKESVERLGDILASIEELLDRFQPTSLAVEAPFFGKNVQSMLKLGRAQGVVLSAGLRRGLTVAEYPPAVVKRRISGRGAASKEQLAGFLEAMYTIPIDPKRALDATDALAVATCHALTVQRTATLSAAGALPTKKKSSTRASSWAKFLAQNPEREA
jgi:crossover junction endodeoxyribonuclease RuvC